jgi:hypothetical protein
VANHREKKESPAIGKITQKLVKDMDYQELQTEIQGYPQDTWVGSAEYAELMHRLRNYSLKRLEEEGYNIPNWRRGGKA